MKIFVVENHADTAESLRMVLEDLGHEVSVAATVQQGLAELPRARPDVLLCDIGLPDGTGWDLLRALPAGTCPFTVAMSGFGMNADSGRSREAGFRRHLLKPFSLSELKLVLAEAESFRVNLR